MSASAEISPEIVELVARRRARHATHPYTAVLHAADDWLRSVDDLDQLPGNLGDWRERFTDDGRMGGEWRRRARPRVADPAALWLAEHHPEELATFPPDV
ncbi:hypothetical protein [Mycetocola zhadangensis]|uniref:Uncharacterized protein n=1 Tax=Mycetocola zhadangensis TaxID=1164595 RepID=A0A3L7J8U5_9MICO|nr:hypothetical protein [Mycetocola zhadangensis]RLQ85871.1 hypothetical protein D9V28_03170 [Mycetocola zhadangensis]